MASLKTIDQRICEKAEMKLDREIEDALNKLSDITYAGSILIRASDHAGFLAKDVNANHLLQVLGEVIKKDALPRRHEDARREFLDNVERLSAEVEELRQGVQS